MPAATLPLPDRGLDFGDGVFETLLLRQGVPACATLHLERLQSGLRVLSFPDCVMEASLYLDSAALAVQAAGWDWASLRLTVTRGSGPRGYAPPESPKPRVLVQVVELDRDAAIMSEPAVLSVSTVRLAAQPLLAGIKHLNRLEQVLAAAQAKRDTVDESLILDHSGNVVSVIAGNLFVVRNGELLTPSLVNCGVSGTRRRLIIEKLAPTLGLKVRETILTLPDIEAADEVFYCNSLQGMRPVARLAERRWQRHPLCTALFEQYLCEMR